FSTYSEFILEILNLILYDNRKSKYFLPPEQLHIILLNGIKRNENVRRTRPEGHAHTKKKLTKAQKVIFIILFMDFDVRICKYIISRSLTGISYTLRRILIVPECRNSSDTFDSC
ncbi:hypothetical protein HZS_5801, partial [Henneguya salminicola]